MEHLGHWLEADVQLWAPTPGSPTKHVLLVRVSDFVDADQQVKDVFDFWWEFFFKYRNKEMCQTIVVHQDDSFSR